MSQNLNVVHVRAFLLCKELLGTCRFQKGLPGYFATLSMRMTALYPNLCLDLFSE